MILINGNFLCRNLTGIERFAFEICKNLDLLLSEKDDVRLFAPLNAKFIPKFTKIKIIQSNKKIFSFPIWDFFVFSSACTKYKATGLNFSNTAPFGKNCGISFIHDIYAKTYPKDFSSKKDKLIRLYCKLSYWNISKNAKKVLTVSNFSKEQIQKEYKVSDSRIFVVPNGWDHFKDINCNFEIFKTHPSLKSKEYYFTLGSLSKRKNLQWIANYASTHPKEMFAISGKAISGLVPNELKILQDLSNVVLLGYVSDEEVKALMSECKAFIFPSYYEGFGIPPLEALSTGARVILAKEASLPEIYGDSVNYIDANNTEVELTEILSKPVESSQKVLDEYTYANAAKKLFKIIEEFL